MKSCIIWMLVEKVIYCSIELVPLDYMVGGYLGVHEVEHLI